MRKNQLNLVQGKTVYKYVIVKLCITGEGNVFRTDGIEITVSNNSLLLLVSKFVQIEICWFQTECTIYIELSFQQHLVVLKSKSFVSYYSPVKSDEYVYHMVFIHNGTLVCFGKIDHSVLVVCLNGRYGFTLCGIDICPVHELGVGHMKSFGNAQLQARRNRYL